LPKGTKPTYQSRNIGFRLARARAQSAWLRDHNGVIAFTASGGSGSGPKRIHLLQDIGARLQQTAHRKTHHRRRGQR